MASFPSPLPSPLAKGEEKSSLAHLDFGRIEHISAQEMAHPLLNPRAGLRGNSAVEIGMSSGRRRAAATDAGRLASRFCFETQLAEAEHVRYVRKPANHLQCGPATLTKARRYPHGNKFEYLTAPGRVFTAKPAETKHMRQIRKLAEHFQCCPAAVAEAGRHTHGNELGKTARWKMVGRG